MDWLQALILGLVQGLTEYLPVSSSGHLELGKALLGVDDGGLTFDIVVHVATVLATLVVLWREIVWLVKGVLRWSWNAETRYALAIVVSMVPVGIVGVCFKDYVEAIYSGQVVRVVGCCLVVTAALLALTHFFPQGFRRQRAEHVSLVNAFLIGIAQACAVLPGLSRSGSTIATGLLLGVDRRQMAQFSFLMVIPPVLGEALLDCKELFSSVATAETAALPAVSLVVGFLAAFVAGCFACRWMIALVKRCQLLWFALYCLVVGIAALVLS